MTTPRYDVIVIGAGPGGYVAAIRASQLGLKTGIIEREHLGGICLNWGCIPTKALLHAAETYRQLKNAPALGLEVNGEIRINIKTLIDRSRRVSAQLNKGVGFLIKKNNIDLIWGEAKIIAPGQIEVSKPTKEPFEPQPEKPNSGLGSGRYMANHIIIATGARPKTLPGLEADGERIWTYFEAMIPKDIPRSLIIVGAGAIGIEFASFYKMLGTDVTVLEAQDKILPNEDKEISQSARRMFEHEGIKIHTGVQVSDVTKNDDGVHIKIKRDGHEQSVFTADRVIVATGVVGNTQGLGLEDLGVHLTNETIPINTVCETNVKGLYAIGDVAGGPMLAHKAQHEAVICAEAIAGNAIEPLDKLKIPSCTYSHPQIASIGLTEKAAEAQLGDIRVGRFSFRGNGKAIALGNPDGFIKTIFDNTTGQLVGAHMLGPDVTELIQGFAIGMQLEATEAEMIRTVFPHPTLSEAIHESVLDAFDRVIHK